MLGPAYCAAAVPVSTKMPAPMMAPMPMAVMLNGPSVLDSLWPSASPLFTMSSTDFRVIRPWSAMGCPSNRHVCNRAAFLPAAPGRPHRNAAPV